VGYTGLRGGLSGPAATQGRLRSAGDACPDAGVDETEPDLDAVAARAVAGLLERSHLVPPDEIAETIAAAAVPLGVSSARIYLADLEQETLRTVSGSRVGSSEVLAIDSTLAGRAYVTVTIQYALADDGHGRGRWRVWLPLIGGTERLGVLELACRDASAGMLARYRMLASLAGLLVASKSPYSDTLAAGRRTGEMALQAEMVWGFLVPRTFATDRVLVAATLEPAYEVGGDAFDYSLVGGHLHVAIFDAVGHDLAAGLISSVGMAAWRSTRRSGGTLHDAVARTEDAIGRQFGENRFLTALLCDLDVASGNFSWVPCGHPPPLLIRRGKVIKELIRRPRLPLGLAYLDRLTRRTGGSSEPPSSAVVPVYTERLEPRDRVLLYTDGVTEGRAADGTPFGLDRLSDFIARHSNSGITAPETLRRLNHAIVEYQRGRLTDDATIVLIEWMPDQTQRLLVSVGSPAQSRDAEAALAESI
jgi:serine/threonine protein phosphatase PrpC